mgnify:CR=1 FL=1
MTRFTGYRIYACPQCGCEHLFPTWGSINLSLPAPRGAFDHQARCQCGARFVAEQGAFLRWAPTPVYPVTPWWTRLLRRWFGQRWPFLRVASEEIPEFLRKKA